MACSSDFFPEETGFFEPLGRFWLFPVTPAVVLRLEDRSVEILSLIGTCSSGDAMTTNHSESQKSPFHFGVVLFLAMGFGQAIFRMTMENYGSVIGLFVSAVAFCAMAVGFVCMLTLGLLMLLTSSSKPKATPANA